MTKLLRHLLLIFIIVSLSGCDQFSSTSISDICTEHPSLCSDLNKDSWCRAEKASIIKYRYQDMLTPHDENKYRLLVNFEDYKICIDRAAQIEHIKLKEKKTDRVRGALNARKELKRLATLTQHSKNPYLLYYHWSRLGNDDALNKFLGYQRSQELESPELQVALASYFVKFDRPKAIETLQHALELYREDDEVDIEIFQSLATIYLKENNYQQAYIWTSVARQAKVDIDIDLIKVETLIHSGKGEAKKLRKIAKNYLNDIQKGDFIRPL